MNITVPTFIIRRFEEASRRATKRIARMQRVNALRTEATGRNVGSLRAARRRQTRIRAAVDEEIARRVAINASPADRPNHAPRQHERLTTNPRKVRRELVSHARAEMQAEAMQRRAA